MRGFLIALAAVSVLGSGAALAAKPAGAAAALNVPAGSYALDKTHASLTWRVKHLGLSWYTARFTSFDSTITLDPAVPTRSTVTVSIDAKSVKTDYPFPDRLNFDEKLAGEQLFNAAQFPAITFKSTKLVATGASTGKLTGDLTFRGVTKPVTLDVTLNAAIIHPMLKTPVIGFSARGEIKRSDYGVTQYLPNIGDTVELVIEAEYTAK
jgi:polyisoprenoid-binding protein YceI